MSNFLESKNLKEHRENLLKEQNNICPLCGEYIEKDKAALDHSHETGYLRQVLHSTCNSFEGMVLHKFKRSGVHKRTDIITYMENLILYWEVDYSDNLKHPTEKKKPPTLGKREFNRINKWYKELYPKRKELSYPKTKKWTKILTRLKKQMDENE